MATHYQRLGIAPSASTEQVRAAYRELARRLHPDRHGNATPAERALADRRMREINEAWRTLGEPTRRRRYDETLRSNSRPAGRPDRQGPSRAVTVPAPEDDDMIEVMGEMGPLQAQVVRGLPWIVLLVVFGAIFVFTAYATAGKSSRAPTTSAAPVTVANGSCLQVRSGPMPPATEVVSCSGPYDVKLIVRVAEPAKCPPGTRTRRLSTDGLLDCVQPS